MDIKAAFLQGETYDDNRNLIVQLPPEAGHPWYMVARMNKPAYVLVEASRRWFNVLDTKLRSYDLVPTRADRCTFVLYAKEARKRPDKTKNQSAPDKEFSQENIDKLFDPVMGNNAKGRRPCGIACFHVDDLFMAVNKEFASRILTCFRNDFEIGSEDTNDIDFVGQRIQWKGQNEKRCQATYQGRSETSSS